MPLENFKGNLEGDLMFGHGLELHSKPFRQRSHVTDCNLSRIFIPAIKRAPLMYKERIKDRTSLE